jgi:hypothetical protein
MTQWYQPRQIASGVSAGKWRYTVSNTKGDNVYAVGVCATNCLGHETADGATRHYADGLAAGELREIDDEDEQRRCLVCNEWTQHRVILWGAPHFPSLPVCAGHDPRPVIKAEVYKHYGIEGT